MLSKKILSTLIATSALTTIGFGSAGCYVPPSPYDTQVLELQANVFDINNQPLAADFDYYLDLSVDNHDGTSTPLSYHIDQQSSDPTSAYGANSSSIGVWNYTSSDLQFWTGGTSCFDSCVSYDEFGCTAYASNCYDSAYTATIQMTDIIPSSVVATIGIDTGINYYLTTGQQQSSFTSVFNGNDYLENDNFYTGLVSDFWGNVVAQSERPATSSAVTKPISAKNAKLGAKSVPASVKVADSAKRQVQIIKDLSTLTPAQKALNDKAISHLTFKVKGVAVAAPIALNAAK